MVLVLRFGAGLSDEQLVVCYCYYSGQVAHLPRANGLVLEAGASQGMHHFTGSESGLDKNQPALRNASFYSLWFE